jgi:Chaperone of endosialidase
MSVTTINLGKIRVNWRGAFASSTAYTINDAVSYSGSSYICVTAYTSTSSFTTDLGAGYWQLMAQGTSANTTAGDITYRGGSGSDVRLPVGSSGQVLTVTPGGLLDWEYPGNAGQDYYVSPNGSDTNDGKTLTRAFRTVRHACNTITGPATLYIKAGTYYEQLPIIVPASVTIIGDGMRDTVISPLIGNVSTTYTATGSSGTTLKVASTSGIGIGMTVTGTGFSSAQTVVAVVDSTTLTISANPDTVPSGTLTFTYLSTDASPVPNQNSTMFLMSNETMLTGVLMIGMSGFTASGSYPTDFTQATVGGVFLRLNPSSPISTKSPYIKDCTAKSSGGVGAIVDGSVHASGNRSMLFWAYNQVHDGGVGLVVCNLGKAEAVSCFTYYCYFGYFTYGGGIIRSLSGNNSYGTYGCVSQGYDSTETPVTGTVYGNMLTITTNTLTGTFQQGEIISQPYAAGITISTATGSTNTATINYASQGSAPFVTGQTIIVSGNGVSGYNGTYTVLTSTSTATTFTLSGAGGLGTGSGGTIKGVATAYVTSVQTGYLYYKQQYGTFNTSTTVTGLTSGATVSVTTDSGQENYLLVLSSLSATPQVGASIQFTSGDTNAYVIQGVSTATVNSVALTIITLAQQKGVVSTDGTTVNVRYNFSNIRLTGHDFLSIGTGGITTTNYPGIPTQAANPANQTIWTFPGRIYYVATDQSGNFSVGQYFSVNQATGAATLNASAFNLSGLTSLRLGTLGAQLGAQINEFSTDGTMSQDSPVKVPTQSAVLTYLGAAYQNISPATDVTYSLGDSTHRWSHLYVGAGSITLGTLTLSDNGGVLQVQSSGVNAGANINAINNGTSNVTVANNANVTVVAAGTTVGTFASSGVTLSALTVSGNLTVNGTTTTVNTETGTSFVASNGLVSTGTYAGSYSDGIVLDYSTGNGRISVGTGDGITFYNNTDSSRASLLAISSSGNLTMTGGTLATSATTANVFNTTATTVNGYGVATAINVAASAASATTLTLGSSSNNNILSINGNGTTGTASLTTNVTNGTTNLFVGNTGTTYVGGAGAGVQIGTSSGNSSLQIQGNSSSGTATITTNVTSGTANIFAGVTGKIQIGGGGTSYVGIGQAPSTFSTSALQIGAGATIYSLGNSTSIGNNFYYNGGNYYIATGAASLYQQSSGAHTFYTATSGSANASLSATQVFNIDTSGNGTFAGTMTSNSDARLKTNVETITNALDKVLALRGVMYDRISTGKRELGSIAQEFESIIPELVFTDGNGIKSIAYANTVSLLIEAIKEQQKQIDELKGKI